MATACWRPEFKSQQPHLAEIKKRGKNMKYTRFEKAKIIGARALQIAMGAPVLIDVPENVVDPIEIARLEFEAGVIPITVKRILPPKIEYKTEKA